MEDDQIRKRKIQKGRSASGEVDEHLDPPMATIFETVEEAEGKEVTPESVPEFEPVHHGEPRVEWDDGEEWEVVEERFEAILEDLFSDWVDEDRGIFEEVRDSLGWSKGDVIWEGMDFDQMFTDSGEFHDFELLSRKDKRAFLRDRLRTQQVSGTAEAGESELDLSLEPKRRIKPLRRAPSAPKAPSDPGPLVSFETETEHRAEELDIGIVPSKGKRRRER